MTNNQLKFGQTVQNVGEKNNAVNDGQSTLRRVFSKLGDIISLRNNKDSNTGIIVNHSSSSTDPLDYLRETLNYLNQVEDAEDDAATTAHLVQSIEATLLRAQLQELGAVEVLLPDDLIVRMAVDIVQLADSEPCGLRGGVVYLEYADRLVNLALGSFRLDHSVPATFDLVVTLRPEQASWLLQPALAVKGYLRKMKKNDLVVVSSTYTLAKNSLYGDDEA